MELTALIVLVYIGIKHYLADFVFQGPFQYRNKGSYGHPGGLLHAFINIVFTLPICIIFGAWWLLIIEFVIHYHMDWFKMWYTHKMGWGPLTHEQFWTLLGADQTVHFLTYAFMMAMWFL